MIPATAEHRTPPSGVVKSFDFASIGIDESTLRTIAASIGRRLEPHCSTHVEKEELRNWARLGIAIAMGKFDPDQMDAKKAGLLSPEKWLCGYLHTKGYYAALDEMRSAHVVGRFRNGRWYHSPVRTTTFTELRAGSERAGFDVDQHQHNEPGFIDRPGPCPVEGRDLLTTISGGLTGIEKEVFDGRYKDELPFGEIASRLNLTPQRVYQIHASIIERTRTQLAAA